MTTKTLTTTWGSLKISITSELHLNPYSELRQALQGFAKADGLPEESSETLIQAALNRAYYEPIRKPNKNKAAQVLGSLGGKAGRGASKARSSEQMRAAANKRWDAYRA